MWGDADGWEGADMSGDADGSEGADGSGADMSGDAGLETETTSEDVVFTGDVAGPRYTVEIII